MPQPLDSQLVKALLAGSHGVVVDRAALEVAVNQQLIHGGSLDTLVLEAKLTDEPTLARILADIWQTAPVAPAVFRAPEAGAVSRLPRRMAVAMGLVPLFVDHKDALHVACLSPLDAVLVAEVGELLKATVVAHVVPELRLRQGLSAAYGHELEERFVSLLRSLDPDAVAVTGADRDQALPGATGTSEAVVTWDMVEALAHLAAQDSREGIARVAVNYARTFLPFAAIFGLRDQHAIGWHRLGPCEGLQFSHPFAIAEDGFVKGAVSSPSPSLLRPDETPGTAAFLGWLGRRRPQSALVVPIVVANRPIGALYADGGVRYRSPRDVGELTAFAARLGPAFESLLRQRHRQHPSLFPQPAPASSGDDLPDPPPLSTLSLSSASMAPAGDDLPEPPALTPNRDDLPAPPLLSMAPAGDDLPMPPPLSLSPTGDDLPAPPMLSTLSLSSLSMAPAGDDLPEPPPLSTLSLSSASMASMASMASASDDLPEPPPLSTLSLSSASMASMASASDDLPEPPPLSTLSLTSASTAAAGDDLPEPPPLSFSPNRDDLPEPPPLSLSPNRDLPEPPPLSFSPNRDLPEPPLLSFSPNRDLPEPPPLSALTAPSVSMASMASASDDLPEPPPLSALTASFGTPTVSMQSLFEAPPLSLFQVPPPAWSSHGDDLPMPPPLSAGDGPGASSMPGAMPSVSGSLRDGSSPFAQGYTPSNTGLGSTLPSSVPSLAADRGLHADAAERSAVVIAGAGEALNEHLRQAPSASSPSAAPFFPLEEGRAPEAWRGALHTTVESGLQGGSVVPVDDDLDWKAVVYQSAPSAEAAMPVSLPPRSRETIDFPALSNSVLADLYDSSADEGPEAAVAGPRMPPPLPPVTMPPMAATTDLPLPLSLGQAPLSTQSHRDVVDLLFAGDEDLVGRASRELVSRGLAAVPALAERFPGPLRVDPFDPGDNVRSADRLGPLIDVLARLGSDGLDAAIPHVDSRHPAHRFAAVLLFGANPDPRAIDLLRNRLHDAEPRIQQLATEALVPFLAHPRFETLLIHLRERTSAATRPYPLEARRRASQLLGEFRDVGSVPLLLGLLGLPEMQDTARHALRTISLQDLGSRPRAWEKWWQRAKKHSRLDWLLEGLASEELELRSAAHRELAGLAGDDFGYRPDADKRSRQRSISVWQQWWVEEQQRTAHPKAAARL